MQGILLSNLKLADTASLPGYTLCTGSNRLPGYSYFVNESGCSALNGACDNQVVRDLFSTDPELWMISLASCTSVDEFEELLFNGFDDVRDVLTRMSIITETSEPLETAWVQFDTPETEDFLVEISTDLPPLSLAEVLTFADYDATIDYLKSITTDDRARRNVYLSIIETMLAVEHAEKTELDAVIDVLFQNLVTALQMAKYVSPESARKFMTYVMKKYVLKVKRG